MTTKQTKKAPEEAAPVPTRPPSALRAGGRFKDPPTEPLSVEAQWKRIDDWYRFLESESASNYPVPDAFNYAWEELDSQYAIEGASTMERGDDLRCTSENPLSAFFYFVEMGFYPPPELMLGLLDCWNTYRASSGALSLEEAFIGKPQKGVGNYASRKTAKYRKMEMQLNFSMLMGEGLSRAQAAEAVSQAMGGKPDADSILRMFRRIGAMPPPRRHQPEK